MIYFRTRASAILYNFLKSIKDDKVLYYFKWLPCIPLTFFKANKRFEFVDILKTLFIYLRKTNIKSNRVPCLLSVGMEVPS